jgi:hypothetical protein
MSRRWSQRSLRGARGDTQGGRRRHEEELGEAGSGHGGVEPLRVAAAAGEEEATSTPRPAPTREREGGGQRGGARRRRERERGGAQRGGEAHRENGWCGSVLHLYVTMKGRSRMSSTDASSGLGELHCKI